MTVQPSSTLPTATVCRYCGRYFPSHARTVMRVTPASLAVSDSEIPAAVALAHAARSASVVCSSWSGV